MTSRSKIRVVIVGIVTLIDSFLRTDAISIAQPPQPIPPGYVRTNPAFVEGEVIVRYKEHHIGETNLAKREDKIRQLGIALQDKFPVAVVTTHPGLGAQRLKLPPGGSVKSAIQNLKTFSEIEYAEPNYKIFPLFSSPPGDRYWLQGPLSLWGMKRIGMEQTWTSSVNVADSIIIAVLDTGIDYYHPDLSSQIWNNSGEYGKTQNEDDDGNNIIDDIHGVNYCWPTDSRYGKQYPTGNPLDTDGHGTAVAGVIGAAVDNSSSEGQGYVAGVHRKAKLMALKVLCADTDPEPSTVLHAAEAINYAWQHGATVLNASWYVGTGTAITSEITGAATGSTIIRQAISDARDHGALFVVAAGNSSAQQDNDSISVYPANYGRVGAADYLDNVMAVAATWDLCTDGQSLDTNPSDTIHYGKCFNGSTPSEKLWENSHFGLNSVAIAAPGWLTYTTMPLSLEPLGVTWPDGTSMAAPHVAGCAALLRAKNAATSPVLHFSPNAVKQILINNADSVSSITGITNGRRLNCFKAYEATTRANVLNGGNLLGGEGLDLAPPAPPAPPAGIRVQ